MLRDCSGSKLQAGRFYCGITCLLKASAGPTPEQNSAEPDPETAPTLVVDSDESAQPPPATEETAEPVPPVPATSDTAASSVAAESKPPAANPLAVLEEKKEVSLPPAATALAVVCAGTAETSATATTSGAGRLTAKADVVTGAGRTCKVEASAAVDAAAVEPGPADHLEAALEDLFSMQENAERADEAEQKSEALSALLQTILARPGVVDASRSAMIQSMLRRPGTADIEAATQALLMEKPAGDAGVDRKPETSHPDAASSSNGAAPNSTAAASPALTRVKEEPGADLGLSSVNSAAPCAPEAASTLESAETGSEEVADPTRGQNTARNAYMRFSRSIRAFLSSSSRY